MLRSWIAASAAEPVAAEDGDGTWLIVALIAALVIGYVVSLYKNPWRPCRWCRGNPSRSGWFFWWSRGACEHCNRTGKRLRFGRRFIFGDPG